MRIASFLLLLFFGLSCFLIALIIQFGLPASMIIKGSQIAYVPVITGIVQILMAIFSIFLNRKVNPPPLKSPTSLRWVLLAVSVIVLFCGYVIINMSIFTPHLFGSEHSVPQIGVVSWLVMSLILATIIYFASKINSTQRPNLMRYFALVIALIAASLTLIQSLLLIYAVPVQPPVTFPFLSGILTLAFVPFAVLLLGLNRDQVSFKQDAKNSNKDLLDA